MMIRVKNVLGGGRISRGKQACGFGFLDAGGSCQEHRKARVPVEANTYQCMTKPKEMVHHLIVWGI